jgi:hypothetical protein
VNAQEESRDLLREALDFNREKARRAAGPAYEELAFTL